MTITYGSSLHSTEHQALVESAYDYVTATGQNGLEDALAFVASEEARSETLQEAKTDGWAAFQQSSREDEKFLGRINWGVLIDGEPADFDDDEALHALIEVADLLKSEIDDESADS